MELLTYKTLEDLSYDGYLLKQAPERVLQFGEGNFLRAFVDYFIDILNEKTGFNSKVVLCQPIAPGLSQMINQQEGLYTLYLRGFENGRKVNDKRIISCVSRCLSPYSQFDDLLSCADNPDLRYIACNTTEAGIVYDPACRFEDRPADSYPGKLTQFLYRRFQSFGSEKGKGFVVLSCELIDDNGKELEKCVLKYAGQWKLGEAFTRWIKEENLFCSTLVDRIVTGYPRNETAQLSEENGYLDNLIDTGEIFGFWVIEAPAWLKEELPFEKAGLPVLITEDHKPYKLRKVRILNGAHTTMVLGAYLAGRDIVRDCMEDPVINGFMNKTIYEEIIPTLTLPQEELNGFAAAVTERFKNPFIDHALLSISLNSTAKWRARVLPTLKDYRNKTGSIPKCISASLAFYISFYKGLRLEENGLFGLRGGREYTIQDDRSVLEYFYSHKDESPQQLTQSILSNTAFWGEDLSLIKGLSEAVSRYMNEAEKKGCLAVMKEIIN